MKQEQGLTRRRFLGRAAAAATAVSIAPREMLGGPRFVPPSEKICVGYVGCGSQGLRQLMPALQNPNLRITAVCDPNRRGDDYPEWSRHELNEKVRRFLDDPSWARNARGGLCGREVGREIVERHYSRRKGSGRVRCAAYADFREMLAREKDLDAVYIMTPEHLHGVIAVRSMRAGKHVITHKPMANVLHEARVARDTARQTKAATHLFCAADRPTTPLIRQWIRSGLIGPVREVHNWSTRPFWPQGMTERPAGRPPAPEGFEWKLWLGPVPDLPYHPAYTHAVFRGWIDFGTGALGDMGHYSFRQIFEILDLGAPSTVEANRSQYWSIENFTWRKHVNRLSWPRASMIRWEFPARGQAPPVALHWYDGGLRPPTPPELEADGEPMPAEGLLFVGDRGKLLADFTGGRPRLLPKARMRDLRPPQAAGPSPVPELEQWIRACRGGAESSASFERAYPFAETILLGTIALRAEGKLRWDAARMRFENSEEANRLMFRPRYRPGWEI